ncbi:MAG: hypothetical protein JWM11_8005 [Planctomycetaceae bacterium]|nr:hypothetical protein [Planctomycetaceae bacterium]
MRFLETAHSKLRSSTDGADFADLFDTSRNRIELSRGTIIQQLLFVLISPKSASTVDNNLFETI